MMSCETRRNCSDIQFNHSYRYDVNEPSTMIGCQNRGQQKQSMPDNWLGVEIRFCIAHLRNGCSKPLIKLKTFRNYCKIAWWLFVLHFVTRYVPYCYECNSLVKVMIFSTRKKRQKNWRLISQLDDFDQDVFIGDAVSSGQQNAKVNNGSADQEFIVIIKDSVSTTNEVNFQTWERCFNEEIDWAMECLSLRSSIEFRTQFWLRLRMRY